MTDKEQTAQEYWSGFPEAPVSSTFKWIDPDGFDHMTTFRAYSGGQLLQIVDKFKQEVLAIGGLPAGFGRSSAPTVATPGTSDAYDWLRDPDGKPVIEKGKATLLVDGGGKKLDDKFNLPCPLHSGKNLWLKRKDDGFWLSHKMDTGGYCNANIHERVTPFDAA